MVSYINWNVDPEIFKLFGAFSLRYYSLLFVSGLALGYYIVKQIYLKEGLAIKDLEKLSIYVFMGTIIGARLGHCLFYEPAYYLSKPLEIFLPFKWEAGGNFQFTGYQGLASHGGAIGVLAGIAIYCQKYKVNFLKELDRIAIATPLSGAFIRLGNFMNSEIIGKPTNSGFGVVFERVDFIPRHPAQLYEAVAYLLIFLTLLWVYSKQKRKKEGFIFGLFLVLLFISRILIEFFKINQVGFESGMFMNMGQLLSMPFVIVGAIIMFRKRKPGKGEANPETHKI